MHCREAAIDDGESNRQRLRPSVNRIERRFRQLESIAQVIADCERTRLKLWTHSAESVQAGVFK